jgi:hypothetical protein
MMLMMMIDDAADDCYDRDDFNYGMLSSDHHTYDQLR